MREGDCMHIRGYSKRKERNKERKQSLSHPARIFRKKTNSSIEIVFTMNLMSCEK